MLVVSMLAVATGFLVFEHGLSVFFPLLFAGQAVWRLVCLSRGRLWPWIDVVSAAVVTGLLVMAGLEGMWEPSTKYGMILILALTVTGLVGAAVAFVDGIRLWRLPKAWHAVTLAVVVSCLGLGALGWDFFYNRLPDAQMDLTSGPVTVPVAAQASDSADWAHSSIAPSPLDLGPALGCPTPTSIRIWAAASRDLTLQAVVFQNGQAVARAPLEISQQHTGSGFAEVVGLKPATAYTYDVLGADGRSVVSADLRDWCRFQTFPAAGDSAASLNFALTSCHRPLEETDDYYSGRIIPERFVMWETLARQNRQSPYNFVLMLGDQVYNDTAYNQALKAANSAVTRQLYRDNYLKYWSHPAYRRLVASVPAFMMEDDHDTRDGWGSIFTDSQLAAQAVRTQAAAVYADFQGWADPQTYPGRPWFAFDYGAVSFFIPDLRSARDATRAAADLPLLGQAQTADLGAWYSAREATAKVLFFGLSIPIANAPQWVVDWLSHNGNGLDDDFRDAWASQPNRPELKTFLDRAFRWMDRTGGRVFTMGGDTHTAMLGRIHPVGQSQASPIVEFSSSGISNFDSTAQSSWSLFQKFFGQNQTEGYGIQVRRVLTGLNFGQIQVAPQAKGYRVSYTVNVQNPASPQSLDAYRVYDTERK